MAARCLEHYTGQRLIYIGEGDGGCTADDQFHQMLEEHWEEVENHRGIQSPDPRIECGGLSLHASPLMPSNGCSRETLPRHA